ncbi:MAG: hypothetical protein HUU08_13355, partial [Candidatus Brocadia sp.]|nr:hypothetical protein [Candidatus Brocadia sp.]
MKSKVSILVFIFLFFAQGCFFNETKFVSIAIADDSWKNWYGIVWRDTDTNTVKYAKQMGYDYVGVKDWNWDYYKNNPDVAGMRFYITDPHLRSDCFADLPNRSSLGNYVAGGAAIDTSIKYTQAQKDWYNRRMVWKSNDPFPNNFAQGYHPTGTTSKFYIVWDVQQQAVIDELIDKIITHIRKYENKSLPFTFAGYILDTPKLSGEFYYIGSDNKERMTDLSYWAGMDSGLVHGTITHEYSTYTEGMAAYYKQLNARLRQEFPGAKWIIEPALLYSDSAPNEWIYSVKNRPDKDELTADFITQEEGLNGNTAFVDDTNIFNSGMNITKSMVGSSQSNEVDEYGNRLIAAKAGINGAWYNWFGRWGGFRSMPNFKYITEVYPRLKLIRCIPNWDNLNNVSLNDRSWDGSVYRSTMSYIDSDVMYSRHPKTGKLFAVFNTTNGVIKLNAGETVISVQNTDGYFIESGNASADFNITGNEIRLKNSVPIAVDSSNGQIKGKGYIFTLSSSSSVPNGSITINSGATYTSSTAVTLALSATDNAGLTGYYLSTSSMVPLASAPGWTAVTSTTSYNANVSYTLSSGNGN